MSIDVQAIDKERQEVKRRDLEILYELLQQHSWTGRLLSFRKGTEEYDTMCIFERVVIADHDFESIPCIILDTNTSIMLNLSQDNNWCFGSSQELIIELDKIQNKELQLVLNIKEE